MERIRALWNRGWLGKVAIGLPVLLILCCIIGVLNPNRGATPGGTGAAPTAAGQAVAPAAEAPTQIPEATAAPEPTAIPEPTAVPPTPEPTNTPEPTAVPTEVPTATPPPEPVRLEGQGQTVTDPVAMPSAVNRVTFTHNGARNFIVIAYDADGKQEFLANTIGAYEGIRPIYDAKERYFEVNADGAWSIVIEPITEDAAAAQGIEGTGDYVSGAFMPEKTGPVPYTFTHSGDKNFIVILTCAGGQDFAANEIGAFEGQAVVAFKQGPCLWDVQANGAWSIRPK